MCRQKTAKDGVLKPQENRMAHTDKRPSRSSVPSDFSAELNSARSKARSRGGLENQENIDAGTTKQVSKRSKKTAPKASDVGNEGNAVATPPQCDMDHESSSDDPGNNPKEVEKDENHNYRR